MLYAGLIVLLLLLSAFYSGSETAYVTANRLRMEIRAQRAGWAGQLARQFIREPATLLTTCLVGNNVALVVYSTLMSLALDPGLTALWQRLLGPVPVDGWVLLSQTVAASALVLVFGEVLPKSLLREPPERAVLALAPPLKLSYWLLLPLIKLAGWASGLIVRLLGVKAENFQQFMRRDFELIIRESREAGALDLDEEETEILENVLELRALRVRDSMVPRTDIHAVEEGAALEAVRSAFIESGHSRLPVYRESLDRIVGVVLAHDLFHDPASLAAITRPVVYVPESKAAKDFLFEILQNGTTFAVVLDEFGGTAGIVTVEDMLEELFGDIRDEHDVAAALLRQLDERTYLAAGRARLEDLEEAFGLALPEGGYDTVAGYLLDRVGTIPEPRESFEFDDLRFTVLEAVANRIVTVRIQKLGE